MLENSQPPVRTNSWRFDFGMKVLLASERILQQQRRVRLRRSLNVFATSTVPIRNSGLAIAALGTAHVFAHGCRPNRRILAFGARPRPCDPYRGRGAAGPSERRYGEIRSLRAYASSLTMRRVFSCPTLSNFLVLTLEVQSLNPETFDAAKAIYFPHCAETDRASHLHLMTPRIVSSILVMIAPDTSDQQGQANSST